MPRKRGKKHQQKKRILAQLGQDAKMAKLLLPPPLKNGPKYSPVYYQSFRGHLFQACTNARHRHCPRTMETNRDNLYCQCPCHTPGLTKHERRKRFLVLKAEALKAVRSKAPRIPRVAGAPRISTGSRGKSKRFRFVRVLPEIPAGIMAVVHEAIIKLKEGSVQEIGDTAIAGGLQKFTGQDPYNQTSVMLHRLLKAGAVEMLP